MENGNINRRQFLRHATAAAVGVAGFPYFVPSSALGKAGAVAPSNRIVMACIGTGKQGTGLMRGFLTKPGTQIVAVCDADSVKRKRAAGRVEKYYSRQSAGGAYKGCDDYLDFRDVLARDDIDAVTVAAPDHWHAIIVCEAARAGKDMYCEKPLSLTIDEARRMVKTVKRYGRILQTGSQQRSSANFRFACELVRSGYIGQVKTVRVWVAWPPRECGLPPMPVPPSLDWDRWLGPAPWRPYHPIIAPPPVPESVVNSPAYELPYVLSDPDPGYGGWPQWRRFRDYSGGIMTDMGAHHFDIAQWALGMDGSGPVEIIPPDGKEYKVLTYKYANGVVMTRDVANGILFTGTEGKVEVNRGYLRTWPDNLIRHKIGPNDVNLYKSNDHYVNWLDCVRSRSKPICDVEIGCSSATVCHLGNLAYQLDRPLKWDPQKWHFVNDPDSDRLLSRAKRSPWHL